MKRFTGEVAFCHSHVIAVWRKRTQVHVYYANDDAPVFEKGQTVTVESENHFPITTSTWTNEWGKLIKDRVRGKYYMYSDGVKVSLEEAQ